MSTATFAKRITKSTVVGGFSIARLVRDVAVSAKDGAVEGWTESRAATKQPAPAPAQPTKMITLA